MNASRTALALGLALLEGGRVFAQETTRVSVDSSGAEGNGDSSYPSISADGRFVAFHSAASDLVASDTNGFEDIFVHDRSTGLTERVSVDSFGAEANYSSFDPVISADGQVVAFSSFASNLVQGDTYASLDVFVHDRTTGITERVSVDSSGAPANFDSHSPAISADGHIVAFWSSATNLVTGDTNGVEDVFIHDRTTGITECVSVDSYGAEGNGGSGYFGVAISADGQIVAFYSLADNLVAADSNQAPDIFVHDRSTGTTECISVDSSGTQGNSSSYYPSMSADGQVVAFSSLDSNLVAGDANGSEDIFVHDRATGVTGRVSVDSSGAEANESSHSSSVSPDGQIVAFSSSASNLVVGDTNSRVDIFVHNRPAGITERVSVDSSGAEGNDNSDPFPAISSAGKAVAFQSLASNLVGGDTNGFDDVFIHELCWIDASWSNYGSGFPGTNGVPSFTAASNPILGSVLTLDLANSYGRFTAGLLFVGFQQTSIHSGWGGDLLVVPALTLVVGLPPSGTSFTGGVPINATLCGFEVDLQAIESDPGAAKGVSFTQGLQLILGH